MAWKEALTKLILQLGIGLLSKFVPFLGTLLGGPLGWIAGWLLGKATDLLYTMVERYLKFKQIDRDIQMKLDAAKLATGVLRNSSVENRTDALQKFKDSVRDLGRLRLQ